MLEAKSTCAQAAADHAPRAAPRFSSLNSGSQKGFLSPRWRILLSGGAAISLTSAALTGMRGASHSCCCRAESACDTLAWVPLRKVNSLQAGRVGGGGAIAKLSLWMGYPVSVPPSCVGACPGLQGRASSGIITLSGPGKSGGKSRCLRWVSVCLWLIGRCSPPVRFGVICNSFLGTIHILCLFFCWCVYLFLIDLWAYFFMPGK